MYFIDDPEHCNFKVDFEPQLPLLPKEHTDSLWEEVNRLMKKGILPLQSTPQYDLPPGRSFTRSPPQQPCFASKFMRSDHNEQGQNSLEVPAGREDKVKGKMKPKKKCLPVESPSAGTDVEVSEQPRLLFREMQPSTVGSGRRAGGRASEKRDSIISPQEGSCQDEIR